MEFGGSSISPLEGSAVRKKRTVIHFDYGGHYVKKGGEIVWIPREEVHHAILIREYVEDVTYELLLEKIRCKVKANDSRRELLLSHFAVGVVPKAPVYIYNDDDLQCYLEPFGNQMRGVLHVETKTNVPSSAYASNEDIVSTCREQSNVDIFGATQGSFNCSANEPPRRDEIVPCNEEQQGIVQFGATDGSFDDDPNLGFLEQNDVDVRDSHFVGGSSNPTLEWDDGMNLVVGQEFANKLEVQKTVEKACFLNHFNFHIEKSDPVRYVLKCSGANDGCKWRLRAAKIKNSDVFSIRTYTKTHTCSRVSASAWVKKRKGTPGLVASLLQEQFPGLQRTPRPKEVIGLVQAKYGVQVSYSTAYRGKVEAASDLRGDREDGYKFLHSYLHMLREVNPGTVTYVEVDEENRFKYLFFALGACVEGFRVMRKVLVVDGTHIKNVYRGVLLVATAQDPNHHHYPIAFGVVDGEKDDSCDWFFNKLKTVIPDVPGLVFLTDRHPSLIKAIAQVYPLSHHGFCIYHLSQNVKAHTSNVNKDTVAAKFREVAQAYTIPEFNVLYDEFKRRYPSAAQYVERRVEVEKWARCYFPGDRYNIDTTNSAESINAVLVQARKYYMLPMIDAIVEKISEWFNKHRQNSNETHKLVPYIDNVLHEACVKAQHMAATVLNSYLLQFNVVANDGMRYFVDLRMKTCLCKRFDIDKYPCVHGIAALIEARKKGYTNLEVHDLCSEFYSMELWQRAYRRTVFLVPHIFHWNVPIDVRSRLVAPPPYNRTSGRPPSVRFRWAGEGSRQRRNKESIYTWFERRENENENENENT